MMNYVNLSTFASNTVINKTKKTNMSGTSKVRGYRLEVLFTTIFYAVSCFIIYAGWRFREYELITAERGTGYYLGIIGVVSMLLLAVYPMRKRIHALSFLGNSMLWFRLHMGLGIVGPVFILFHANFGLGSLNSKMALLSMIIVAVSGIVGRYIYVRFHYGLTEQIVNLAKLRDDLEQEKEELSINKLFEDIPEAKKELFDFAEIMHKPPGSLVNSIVRIVGAGWRAQFIYWKMRRIIRAYLHNLAVYYLLSADGRELTFARKRQIRSQFRNRIRRFFTLAFRVTTLNIYERSFALWHVLHIPLVFLMLVAVVVHILAVHLF
jgi:hypothetical protein